MTPKRLFVFWFGPSMSPFRRKALWVLKRKAKIPIHLVHETNLRNWIREGHPLHPAFRNLSATHKSDYLRVYFMLNHGGGYADLKPITFDWRPYFDLLDDTNYQFLGYPEIDPGSVAGGPEIERNWQSLVGAGYYIFRPNGTFAALWMNRIHEVLDEKERDLQDNPGGYHPRAVRGGVFQPSNRRERGLRSKYPLNWTEINGSIFHPLQVEQLGEFSQNLPRVRWKRYR